MAEIKELRQAENVVRLEGIVENINIEEKGTGQDAFIVGEIDVLVNDDTYTVGVYSKKYNQKKEVSGLYKGFVTIMNDYKSMKKNGKDEADKIRIETGENGLNEYFGQDGTLKSYPQITAKFINRLKSSDTFTPKAEFTLEMVVKSIVEEMKNDEATGRAIIKGLVPVYGDKVIPFDVIAQSGKHADYITSNWEKGITVKVHGDIINKRIVTKTKIEAEFGEDREEEKVREVREWVIKGGSKTDEESKDAYDMKDIKRGIENREKYLEEKKNKKSQSQSNSRNAVKNKGSNKPDPFADDGKPIDISDDDLPF